MIGSLTTATKVAGLTYRLLSTSTMIGFLLFGLVQVAREVNKQRLGG